MESLSWAEGAAIRRGGYVCECVCRRTEIACRRETECFISLDSRELGGVTPNCCSKGKLKCERHSHTAGASAEHSWHDSLLTNNPNFIQPAWPAEWLQCVEFTLWGGQCPARSSSLSLSVWGGTVRKPLISSAGQFGYLTSSIAAWNSDLFLP